MKWSINLLEKKIKIKFKNRQILEKALTHRSFLNESKRALESNERLEFLGDAVLELVTSQFLFETFPQKPEGQLTNLRSKIVQTKTLAYVANNLQLGELLRLSKGETQSGGAKNLSLLANTFEAVVGAIYLDRGFSRAQKFIQNSLLSNFEQIIKDAQVQDYKSLLQERVQAQDEPSPTYEITKAVGPDHDRTFTTTVTFFGKKQGWGTGKSKQEAEQKAAKKALEKLTKSG